MSKKIKMDKSFAYFYCEGCDRPHAVNLHANGAPQWQFSGSEESPTFRPSVLAKYTHPKGHSNENPAPIGYNGEMVTEVCHSFVTNGRIEYLGDCTHHLANKTIDLPDWDEERCWK